MRTPMYQKATVALLCLAALTAGAPAGAAPLGIRDESLVVTFFGKDRGYDLHAITWRKGDVALAEFKADAENGKLFEVTLRANDGRGIPLFPRQMPKGTKHPPTDEIVLDNHSQCRRRSEASASTGDQRTLTLRWEGCDAQAATGKRAEPGVADVVVTLAASESKPGIEWRIEVTPRSGRYGVWLVQFPFVRLVPPGRTPANDVFVYPRGVGRMIPNPFDGGARARYGFKDQFLPYPGALKMQWAALYDTELGGLYLATHDPKGHQKDFVHHPREDGVWVSVIHYPTRMGKAGVGYKSAYPFVTQYTRGHWYDAAQIHRRWALDVWATKGPLARRADIPQWFKDAPLVLRVSTKGPVRKAADTTAKYKAYFGYDGPIPLIWYIWSEKRDAETSKADSAEMHAGNPFPAKAGFKEAVTQLRAKGIYVQPYINARTFDIPGGVSNIPPDILPSTVREQNGRPRPWRAASPGFLDMCRSTDFFQNSVRDVGVRLAREFGAKGAYLDQFGGLQHACFDPNHGHAPGGGHWQVGAARKLADKARSAVRAVDSDAVFFGENPSDAFIDALDGVLYHEDVWPGLIPLVPAVYGGHWITFGRNLNANLDDDVAFRLALSNTLVFGSKLGRIWTDSDSFLTDARFAKNMTLLKTAVHLRVAAKDYLQFGRLLPPLDFRSDPPEVMATGTRRSTGTGLVSRQPAIMSSVWEALDGSMGIVLFNISTSAQSYEFTLAADRHPAVRKAVEVQQVTPGGATTTLGPLAPLNPILKGQLAPDEMRLLVIK
ncbi:MAG TPA: DUF6259 domain-containing protein [Vicinamibacterales bacterium]|nr:DUF6259 domain-containing protein [Vicinamibacterales bacterium]